ncbi:hypothetical protein PHMEG_0009083 [Phytophthora megakarya]|uniref:Uncharacterized protein n=1 Tax=Phytophthora megakarya TaxID=4795 RepID=A0A225WHY7_9STRA|nr:hypothetical protein PHMEG_0009083 [Phytophthora megakarya]
MPQKWRDLDAFTRSFVAYMQEVCDETTAQLARALDGFVMKPEGWRLVSEEDRVPIFGSRYIEGAIALVYRSESRRTTHRVQQEGAPVVRKISAVLACIPKKGNKEVCLHYLSKRGCNARSASVYTFKDRVHFWPLLIPDKVLEYIETKLGGVSARHNEN